MEQNYSQSVIVSARTKDIVTTALLTSLVFIATRFINLKLPISVNGGLIHLGNTMLFMAAIVFGGKKAAAAGALGMALFDISSGWAAWAPFTFVVRGVMGYIIGTISNMNGRKGNSFFWNLLGIIAGGLWMLGGYYLTEVILYGNWIQPVTSIPGNLVQIAAGTLGIPLAAALKKTKVA